MATTTQAGAAWTLLGFGIMGAAILVSGLSWLTFSDLADELNSDASFMDWVGTQGSNLAAFALGGVVMQLAMLIDRG